MRGAALLSLVALSALAGAPAAAQVACTGGPCASGAGCLCSNLSNSGEACGYIASMNGNCSGCHNCPGSGWIMGTGITCSGYPLHCSSPDSEWKACVPGGLLPAPPAGSVTKTACPPFNMCKVATDFTITALVRDPGAPALTATCLEKNTDVMPLFNIFGDDERVCEVLADSQHTAFRLRIIQYGQVCCGARSKARCLDSSTMCAADADYQANYTESAWGNSSITCAYIESMLLSMFDYNDGYRLNWADVTAKQIGCTKWNHDLLDFREGFQADHGTSDVSIATVLAGAQARKCCGGKGTRTGVANCATTTLPPTPAPPPAPLAKAPADTKHFVELAVTMPYTEDEFMAPAVQTSFKKALASAAGTVPENVAIVSVKSARRRSSSVVVQTKILAKDAAAVTTMKSTLGLGDALKTKLNAALKKEKLKESTFVTAPVTGSAAVLSRSTASTTNMLTTALTLTVLARM